ncbi:MAG: VCBS repeat-containing protein [Elusimicrobia bacterium]|nr:VCBS repeat-containing protein [Elusimicrobiota bacterium]
MKNLSRILFLSLSFSVASISLHAYSFNADYFEDVTKDVFWPDERPVMTEASAAWGDFTNNGYWDLAICGLDKGVPRTYIYKHNGNQVNPKLERITTHNIVGVAGGDIAWLDYNNDGRLDLLIGGYTGNISGENPVMQLYENRGDGVFVKAVEFPGTYFCSFAIADFNNNGYMDIAVIGERISPSIYSNTGGSYINTGHLDRVAPAGSRDGSIMWLDITNNGLYDLVQIGLKPPDIGIINESFSKIYEQTNSGFIDRGGLSLAGISGEIHAADINADGLMDFSYLGNKEYDYVKEEGAGAVFLNSGSGISFSSYTLPVALYDSSHAWGDLNGDGYMELVMTGNNQFEQPQLNIIHFSTSDYSSSTVSTFTAYGVSKGKVRLTDYDMDGRLDIFLIGSGSIRLLKNKKASPNHSPPRVTDLRSRYYNDKLYLMWNDPVFDPDEETPNDGFYYNYRVGSSSGTEDIVPARYGSPLLGNFLTKVTSSTVSDSDIEAGNVDVSDYRHVRVMNVSGSGYYWAVQTIDASLGHSWATSYGEGWSEQQVFMDETPPTGVPGKPYTDSAFTYDEKLVFKFNQATASDPETGIYGAYVELTEIDPDSIEKIIYEGEISNKLRETVWRDGVGYFEYTGRVNHGYKIRVRARHGYDMSLPTETYRPDLYATEGDPEGLWHPDSPHYTDWSEMSDGVKIIQLLTLDRNLIKEGDNMRINPALRESGRVHIRVFDRFGNLKINLLEERVEQGKEPTVFWNGSDSSKKPLPGGMYFLNIQVPRGEDTQKVILLR